MPASTPEATISKIVAAGPTPAREPELRGALDNIERLLRRHETLEPILLRGRMEQAWLMAERALR